MSTTLTEAERIEKAAAEIKEICTKYNVILNAKLNTFVQVAPAQEAPAIITPQ